MQFTQDLFQEDLTEGRAFEKAFKDQHGGVGPANGEAHAHGRVKLGTAVNTCQHLTTTSCTLQGTHLTAKPHSRPPHRPAPPRAAMMVEILAQLN